MTTLLLTLLLSVAVVALMIVGLGIKMFFKKKGEFKRHCSSMDPYTGERSGCICGKKIPCKDSTHYHPLEVNQEFLNECKP